MKKGECKRCGKCCIEAWRFQYISKSRDFKEFLTAEDVTPNHIIGYPSYVAEGVYIGTCPSCVFVDDIASCIEGTRKPEICRAFPLFESDTKLIGCPGYYWEGDDNG